MKAFGKMNEQGKNFYGFFDLILSVQKYQSKFEEHKMSIKDIIDLIKDDKDKLIRLGYYNGMSKRPYRVKEICDSYGLKCKINNNGIGVYYDTLWNSEEEVFQTMRDNYRYLKTI